MKKLFASIGCISLLLIFFGCSPNQETTKDIVPKTSSVEKTPQKELAGLNVKLTKLTKIKSGEKDDKEAIMKISVHLKNITANPMNYDSLGMEIYNSKKEKLKWYPSTNYGGILAAKKEIDGDAFYVSKGEGPYTVLYKDLMKPAQELKWEQVEAHE